MNRIGSRPPASLEERIAYRGCRNCIGFCSASGMCRKDNTAVLNTHWCLSWAWRVEPRVTWMSNFAGKELHQEPIWPEDLTCSVPGCPGAGHDLTRFGLCPCCGARPEPQALQDLTDPIPF